MAELERGWILAFGEIEGLRWVLRNNRMAFGSGVASRVRRVEPGDTFVLYVTRGAFHNPTRDHSQLAGLATVTSAVRALHQPIEIAGREFTLTCSLQVDVVLAERHGVPIAPLVPKLSFIKRKDVWGQYLRSGLVELGTKDLRLLRSAVARAGGIVERAGRAAKRPQAAVPESVREVP